MPWYHHFVKMNPNRHQTLNPKLQPFVATPVELYTYIYPTSKDKQVIVKTIKKMKMLAQVNMNAKCLINCVRENKKAEIFIFCFFTWRDNWEKKEKHRSEELSCLLRSLPVCLSVTVVLCVKRGRERHARTRTRVFRFL